MMKRLNRLMAFVALFFPLFASAQDMAVSTTFYKTFVSSANLDYMDQAKASDLLLYSESFAGKDKCRSYKSMRRAGTIMTIVGPVVFVGGVVTLIAGVLRSEDNEDQGLGLAGIGLIGMGSGAVLTGAGIPLMIVGGIKSRQYCGKSSSMIIRSGKNGVGAALVF